jgi:hypothetical protein
VLKMKEKRASRSAYWGLSPTVREKTASFPGAPKTRGRRLPSRPSSPKMSAMVGARPSRSTKPLTRTLCGSLGKRNTSGIAVLSS